MAQDSQRELQDLITVHGFYVGLLEKGLGHGVPEKEKLAILGGNAKRLLRITT